MKRFRSHYAREAHIMLESIGAVAERRTRHGLLYRLPNNRTVLVSTGRAQDQRALLNLRAEITRLMEN